MTQSSAASLGADLNPPLPPQSHARQTLGIVGFSPSASLLSYFDLGRITRNTARRTPLALKSFSRDASRGARLRPGGCSLQCFPGAIRGRLTRFANRRSPVRERAY